MLAQLRHDAREDQILCVLLERGDVDYIHRAVLEAPEGQVADRAFVRDEPGATRGDVGEPVSHFADRGHVVRPPVLAGRMVLHPAQQVAEERLELPERAHAMRP